MFFLLKGWDCGGAESQPFPILSQLNLNMVTKEHFLNALEIIKEYMAQIEEKYAGTKTPIAKWVEENRPDMQYGCGQVTTRLFNTMQYIDIHDPKQIVPRYIEDIQKHHLFSLKGFGPMQWELFLKTIKKD